MPTALTRLRDHAGWFAALLVAAALVAGLAAGITGLLGHQTTVGVRAGLAERSGAYLGLRVSVPLADDAAEQDAQVRGMIQRRLAGIPLPFAVDRTVQGVATLTDGDGDSRRVVVLSLEGSGLGVEVVDGAPAGAGEVLVHADAAARLGLAPGDDILIEGETFAVAGAWRPADRLDPRWLGDPLVELGVDEETPGPVLVAESAWGGWPDADPLARWTLVPDAAAADIDGLAGLGGAWRTLQQAWEGDPDGLRGITRSGRFLQTVNALEARLAGLRAVEPIALLLLAGVAIVAFAELGRMLSVLRASETALLWSRGATAPGLAARSAVDAAIVAGAGASAGVATAALALIALSGEPPGVAILVPPVLATVALATVAVGLAILRSASRQTVRDPGDSARRTRLASGGVVVLALGAAAVSVWQLLLYGSPVTPTAGGGRAVDPVAAPAPVLALLGVSLALVALLPAAARLDERLAARGGIRRLLATRAVARRPALAFSTALVVALATGTLVTAAGYQGTWGATFELAGQVRAGADFRVHVDAPGMPAAEIAEVRGLPGVTGVAPLDLQILDFGTGTGTIVSVAPDALERVAADFPGLFDPATTADAVRIAEVGGLIPPGSREFELDLATSAVDVPPEVAVILRDGFGGMRTVPLEIVETVPATDPADGAPDAATGAVTTAVTKYSGPLPALDGDADVRLVAVDIRFSPGAIADEATGTVSLRAVAATGDGGRADVPLDAAWTPDSFDVSSWPPTPVGDRGFEVGPDPGLVRLSTTLDDALGDASRDETRPPAAVSQSLAESYDVEVGDVLDFPFGRPGERITVTVAAVVPAIPTSPTAVAVLLDLATLQHRALRTGEELPAAQDLWVASDDVAAATTALRAALPSNSRVESARDPAGRVTLGAPAIALWLAAAGCALLAAATAAAASRSLRRDRRRGVAVLRALGLGARDQALIRTRELAAVIGFGTAAGLVSGAVVVLLTVPPLARAAVPDWDPLLPVVPGVDLAGLGLGLGAFALALAGIVAAASAATAREARTASPSEEAR